MSPIQSPNSSTPPLSDPSLAKLIDTHEHEVRSFKDSVESLAVEHKQLLQRFDAVLNQIKD